MAASVRFRDRGSDAPELRPVYGREPELRALRGWLSTAQQGALFYLHGPGGIGKSAVLRAVRDELERMDQGVVPFDLRELPPQPAGVEAALDRAIEQLGPRGGTLLLDSFDAHARLEPWYRARLRDNPGTGVRWIVAGRRTLQRDWLQGPEAVAGLNLLRLSPLGAEAELALAKAVPEPLVDHVLQLCLGHPGALAEAVRLVRAGVQQPALLVDRVYAAVVEGSETPPSPAHAEALGVAALLRAVDPRLLAAALDTPEAARLYAWLQGHSAMQATEGRLVMDALFAQALRREFQLSQPEAYSRRILQLGRLLAERLERANRPEARQAAVEGLLRLGQESSDLPLPAVRVEPVPIEGARALLARERPDFAPGIDLSGRVQCQLVRAQDQLLGCLLIADPRSRALRHHGEARGVRAFLSARAVNAAERVVLVEPVVFGGARGRIPAARGVFEVVARMLHSDRRLSVGLVACAPEDQALPAFATQLGMLAPIASIVQIPAERDSALWFCDHARRGAAACLYARLVERHAPRGQTVRGLGVAQ